MVLQVLFTFTAVSLLSRSSCHNYPSTEILRDSWLFPLSIPSGKRMGRQMPPHHEPDAVLINDGGSRKPSFPGGGFPGFPGGPGIYGAPRGPGGSGYPRRPDFPGVYGFPGTGRRPGINRNPGAFDLPGMPQLPPGPGVFEIPEQGTPSFPNLYGTPRGPGIPGPGVFGIPAGRPPIIPGVFLTPEGHSGPIMPNGPGIFGMPDGQGSPGTFGVPNGPPYPGEPPFGRPGVFAGAGGESVPGFFIPGGIPNIPEPAGEYPAIRGHGPEAFVPGDMHRFGPGGIVPGVFYPETFFPIQPDSSGGYSPRRNVYGGAGSREMYDDPIADIFPIIDKSPLLSAVPI